MWAFYGLGEQKLGQKQLFKWYRETNIRNFQKK
jgi:hypothetical protein